MRLIFLVLLALNALAADISGIWSGQVKGRNGEPEDISFQFKMTGTKLTGTMFGDEFDLTVEEGTVEGDRVRFVVIATNYYSNNKTRFLLTGVVKNDEMELTRERELGVNDKPGPGNKQTLRLKRLI